MRPSMVGITKEGLLWKVIGFFKTGIELHNPDNKYRDKRKQKISEEDIVDQMANFSFSTNYNLIFNAINQALGALKEENNEIDDEELDDVHNEITKFVEDKIKSLFKEKRRKNGR